MRIARCLGVLVVVMTLVLGCEVPSFGDTAANGTTALPQIPQTLSSGSGCTAASKQTTNRTPWAQPMLRLDQVWQFVQGSGVTVGVVDTGVNDSAATLAGQVTGAGKDCVGHGTFVAGLIAGRQQGGIGFSGIAPSAHIYAAPATASDGTTSDTMIAAGITAAVNAGCKVVLVAPSVAAPSTALANAVQYATARGVLLVAPATADSQSQPGQRFPAQYPTVLSVGDVGPGNALPQTAGSGSRVDLVAPGDSVMSVGPGSSGYFIGSGASFAAATVAGTAALVDAYRPGLAPAQVIHRLEATAYHPGTAVPDTQRGYGLVDPVAAVTTVLPEEFGTAVKLARTQPVAMPAPTPQPDYSSALAVAGGAALVVLLVAALAVVLPRGRRRGWRPAIVARSTRR